jgi:hypothetical protein
MQIGLQRPIAADAPSGERSVLAGTSMAASIGVSVLTLMINMLVAHMAGWPRIATGRRAPPFTAGA